MKITRTAAAFVTGAGSGIGRAIALGIASRGGRVTVADISEKNGLETVRLINEQRDVSSNSRVGSVDAIFVYCNVCIPGQLVQALDKHMQTFGRLDICVNNAGIGETSYFLEDTSKDGTGTWRKTLDINLAAVIDGTRLAAQIMQENGIRGIIINVASAAGLYPAGNAPVYGASKGGVVMFTRSLGPLKKQFGIRVNALCPEYVETALVSKPLGSGDKTLARLVGSVGGFIDINEVVAGALELVEDESKTGECMWITNRHGKRYWPFDKEEEVWRVTTKTPKQDAGKRPDLPKEYCKIIVHTLSTDFGAATKIVAVPLKLPVSKGKVLVRYLYAGINASDVNFSAGRYFGGKAAASKKLPFDAGFEAVGVIVAASENVVSPALRVGASVATLSYGGFSEFAEVEARLVIPVASASPATVAMLTSGLTASIALERAGRMGTAETVLVTAAAGGTGQFAVQLAALAGNRVIATCGSADKAAMLLDLGASRVIDYRKEDVGAVLRSEFPAGVDLIYESVGGAMFDTCLKSLAKNGRLIVIGMMSQYTAGSTNEWAMPSYPGLCERLLWNSQSVCGFFLPQHAAHFKRHLQRLTNLHQSGKLKIAIDPTTFKSLESVKDAVEHLHSGKSIGKVIVQIADNVDTAVTPSKL